MGVAGTAGVFSRCCEETLLVLRENRQALLAVVDVSVTIGFVCEFTVLASDAALDTSFDSRC
jgi:hypothetical protein